MTANPDQASYLQRLIANHDRVRTLNEEDFCWQISQNNLRPQNPLQNPLSPVEEGIFHPQKMDLKWPLKQEKFRSKDWIISLYTNSLGWGSCVVVQTLVPTPQKIRLEVRLVWRRFALFNAEELAVSFAGPLGLP